MKVLCFQPKSFRWKTHSKTLPEVPDQAIDEQVHDALVVFVHAETCDAADNRADSVLRQAVKHVKWLANKRGFKNIILHSFTHLGGETAPPDFARSFLDRLAERLRTTGYQVWSTPFGYFCEWDLSVHGESLAKVWKEIR